MGPATGDSGTSAIQRPSISCANSIVRFIVTSQLVPLEPDFRVTPMQFPSVGQAVFAEIQQARPLSCS